MPDPSPLVPVLAMAIVLVVGLGSPMRTVSQSNIADASPVAGLCDGMTDDANASPSPASEPCPGFSPPATRTARSAIMVEARDVFFAPSAIEVPAGAASIRLQNAGQVVHNLTIDELDVQIVTVVGAAGEIEAEDLPPGTYQFYCSISGHRQAGMEGTLIVR